MLSALCLIASGLALALAAKLSSDAAAAARASLLSSSREREVARRDAARALARFSSPASRALSRLASEERAS